MTHYGPFPEVSADLDLAGHQEAAESISMPDFPSDVEFSERGDGPALLLLPGSFGTGAGWKAVTDRLSVRYRLVTTSLLGYGATSERRPLGNTTMQQQTDIIAYLILLSSVWVNAASD